MAGTICRGNCYQGSPLAIKYNFREIRGKVRNEDKGKTCVKCGNCQIKIYDFKDGNNCPCCNNKLRTASRYKPENLVHHIEDSKKKIKIPKTVEMEDGSKQEIVQIVVLPGLPLLDSPVYYIPKIQELQKVI